MAVVRADRKQVEHSLGATQSELLDLARSCDSVPTSIEPNSPLNVPAPVTKNIIRNGLIAAGLMNVGGVLLFSRAFTNAAINEADPVVMSNFGLMMIIIWGLAYIGAATITSSIKWIAGVFAVEKLVYVAVWLRWLSENNLAELYSKDFLAGAFFSIYGANDLVFMVFFIWIFFATVRAK